jgi:hypothetical protein
MQDGPPIFLTSVVVYFCAGRCRLRAFFLFCSLVNVSTKSAMRAQQGERTVRCIGMTQLTLQLAATHDHWFEEPAALRAFPALKLWWKHLSKQHPIIADGLEWIGCGVIAAAVLFGTLIANA